MQTVCNMYWDAGKGNLTAQNTRKPFDGWGSAPDLAGSLLRSRKPPIWWETLAVPSPRTPFPALGPSGLASSTPTPKLVPTPLRASTRDGHASGLTDGHTVPFFKPFIPPKSGFWWYIPPICSRFKNNAPLNFANFSTSHRMVEINF